MYAWLTQKVEWALLKGEQWRQSSKNATRTATELSIFKSLGLACISISELNPPIYYSIILIFPDGYENIRACCGLSSRIAPLSLDLDEGILNAKKNKGFSHRAWSFCWKHHRATANSPCGWFEGPSCPQGKRLLRGIQSWHGRPFNDWIKRSSRIQISEQGSCSHVWPWRTYGLPPRLCPPLPLNSSSPAQQ